MKTLLVDDEFAAISELKGKLQAFFPGIKIAGEATNVKEALQKIEELEPELIFLDIEMPEGNGFDLVRKLKRDRRPEIIFVTSQPDYALQAFDVAALSYLLKPIDDEALKKAIALGMKRIDEKNSSKRLEALLFNMNSREAKLKKVGIPSDTGVEFVFAGDIICCEGENGYTRIYLIDGHTRLSSYSIGEFSKMLKPFNFYPVHRSYLANYQHVRAYGNSGSLEMSNGKIIDVSRRRRPEVMKWLEKDS
jgi:two-component system LytT family response regulator